ncbi:GNAT family N-acetyltransferase [Knoellia subterranea]|uniref:Puromycin N-acetyltransferase n=1 Tax=Knoellia subterranea KCTC 19937 TaxID=1385521 RepID=A0A0A0JKH7_9MICO|nr:GNAT family N-acetyltransferase [Knoellia subterranea]KGN36146.1 puromycin N-acetyltransferase [Knoellia subterranea KCTC 19937]
MGALTVRPARPTERDVVVDTLTRAFRDDPVNRYIGSRPERDRRVWETLMRFEHGGDAVVDVALDGTDVVGVGVWDRPGHRPPLSARLLAGPYFVRALGREATKGAHVEQWLRTHRPQEPYWYLAHLGAVEGGRGVGTALLTHRLGEIDAAGGHTAYLESSNERNLPLYERFGFIVTERLAGGPAGSPPVWGMLRAPVD